jgi:hypothetical protein
MWSIEAEAIAVTAGTINEQHQLVRKRGRFIKFRHAAKLCNSM